MFLISKKNLPQQMSTILWSPSFAGQSGDRQNRGGAKPLVTADSRHSSGRLSPGPQETEPKSSTALLFSAKRFVSTGTDSRPAERVGVGSDEGEVGVNQDHGWDSIPEVPGSILGTTCEPQKEEEGLDGGGEGGEGGVNTSASN